MKQKKYKVRLQDQEIEKIIDSISCTIRNAHLKMNNISLAFYGSRTKLEKKGGDIDLILSVPEFILASVSTLKISILNEICKNIGDRKIDLLIMSTSGYQSEFEKKALQEAVFIKTWHI
ncbi:MAG TPA: hypothetical protein VJB34_10080 [Bdellovibrionota bacterium]|nr:hypothetical protein [Bdellovibrionota bacterium]